jgi:hypothetical protein
VFSAGNDIADFLNNPPAEQDAPVFRFLRNLAAYPKPIVAAVCLEHGAPTLLTEDRDFSRFAGISVLTLAAFLGG